MAMVAHLTESIYRRYAISDESSLRESAKKLSALHEAELGSPRTVIPIKGKSG